MPPDSPRQPPGLLGKIVALLTTGVLLVIGFMFSLLLLAVAAAIALLVLGYLWWKTRALRRHLREQAPGGMNPPDVADGTVFEGEAVRVDLDDGRIRVTDTADRDVAAPGDSPRDR